jgi:predicted transposase/invertase (TIGR01784 family)
MEKIQHGRYMNPLTDFAFKYLFSREESKELLISFLNEIINREDKINDIQYLLTEQLGKREQYRKAIFDIHCINEKGEKFIVEMQMVRQEHFMDRILFYSTFPIQQQAIKGYWNYELKPLYHIAIANFILFDDEHAVGFISLVRENTWKKVSNKLNFITVELPKFNKKLKELQTAMDNWLFCLKYLPTLEEQPIEIKGTIFDKLFEAAEINKLTPGDMRTYNRSVTKDPDVRLAMDYSRKMGKEEGREEGLLFKGMEIAINLLKINMPVKDIAKVTGLTPTQIQQINY